MTLSRASLIKVLNKLSDWMVNLTVINAAVPENAGGALVVTNHVSRLDTIFLMIATKRTDLKALVASNYRKVPVFSHVVEKLGAIWVNRGEGDFAAIREVTESIEEGWIVGLAPEGKRSKSGKMIEAKQGVALMAMKTGAPIIPVGLTGTADMGRAFSKFRKMDVTVHFGEPFFIPERQEDEHNRDYVQRVLDDIMCHIAVLVPEENRGFYADHPRLKALLAEAKPV